MRLINMTAKKNRWHSGDTIVEVLIAITVLSMALGTGFAIVSQSNKGLQANKEQFQAQQLANQQVELLRASNAGGRDDFVGPNCLLNGTPIIVASGGSCSNMPMGGASIYTVDISCVSGATNGQTCDPAPAVGQTKTYSVLVTWENVKGAQSQLELQYAM